MYDHHALVTWQQTDRRLTEAAERRRLNLEALERARAKTAADHVPEKLVETVPSPIQVCTELVTSSPC